MQINSLSGHRLSGRRYMFKTLLVMKLIAFIMFATCLQVSATGNSQSITLSEKNAPLPKVFEAIEKQTRYVFFFDAELLSKAKKATIQVNNASIEDVLRSCFKDQPFKYAIVGNIIVVQQKDNTTLYTMSALPVPPVVRGRVMSEDNKPLSGAAVVVKNKNRGTNTDSDGRFSIEAESGDILVISYVGYAAKEVDVTGNGILNISLQPEEKTAEDLVVIAYGKVKKTDLTGSVSQIKAADITSYPTTNVIQALSGRAPGVRVMQNNGTPGSPISVRIRGTNSIMGGNEPLYVIDGVPSTATYLQNADIESMEILKDASSTAMYGSRGGNGVVLITTRSGRKSQPTKVNLDMGYSTQSITKKMKLMSAHQYALFYNEVAKNDGKPARFTDHQVDSFRNVKGTDWQDLMLRNAPMFNGNVSMTGGSEKTSLFLSAGVLSQEGIIPNSDYNRYSLRINLKHDISKMFTVDYTATYTRSDRSTQSSDRANRGIDMFGGMLYAPPTVGPYNELGRYVNFNGLYPGFVSSSLVNPVATQNEQSNKIKADDFVSNVNLRMKLNKDLEVRVSGNILNSNTRHDFFKNREPYGLNSPGQASINTTQFTTLLNENVISYRKIFSGKHNVDVVAGIANQLDKTTTLGSGDALGFLSNELYTGSLRSAETPGLPSSEYSKTALSSFIGRVNYGFDDRYLLTLGFRRDGYSPYSKEFRWESFPSGAVAWRISNEQILRNSKLVSDLKIRASYGRTGNTSIKPYESLNMLKDYAVIFNDALYIGYAPKPEYVQKMRWEITDQMDLGMDIALLNNKIRFTADYYHKKTKYLLNKVQMPTSMGYETSLRNVGEISNKGVELAIDATIVSNGNFKWDLGGNIAFNKNRVEKLYENQDIPGNTINTGAITDYVNLLRAGEEAFVFYGYRETGYTDKGFIKYEDKNGDNAINVSDRSIIGNPNPDFIYGLNSVMKYKGLELTLFFQGSQGNDIFNLNKASNLDLGVGLNQPEEVFNDHWTPENPKAKYPKLVTGLNGNFSSRFVEDGSYMKLKNVMLAYSLPFKKWNIPYFKSVQFYVSGQNLLVFTRYSGYDPEVNAYGSANSLTQGVDYTVYPNSKSVTFGLRCVF